MTDKSSKTLESNPLLEFVKALAVRQARIDAGVLHDAQLEQRKKTADDLRKVVAGEKLTPKYRINELSREGLVEYGRYAKAWRLTKHGQMLLDEADSTRGKPV